MNSEFTIAVHSLVLLAHLPDHMESGQKIADNVSTSPARICKIGGGYILQRDPDEITLG